MPSGRQGDRVAFAVALQPHDVLGGATLAVALFVWSRPVCFLPERICRDRAYVSSTQNQKRWTGVIVPLTSTEYDTTID